MRRFVPDAALVALLLLLPLIMFWPQTVGGQTLLPTENLYQFEPFASDRAEAGAPAVPHNALVSDLILQNYQWKSFIRESFAQGELPLWNPHQFAGISFMAAGQQSTLYPFSVLYYVLPLTAAYGWFTVSQLWLAGVFMYLFGRGLGQSRAGAALGGVVYQLSAFFVISAVFPMIIAAAVWLPLILLMIEFVIRQQPGLRGRPATIPWVAVGAVAVGCNILAGHVEITYYTLIIAAYYAAVRLAYALWRRRRDYPLGERHRAALFVGGRGLWLVAMMALGLGLGAVQFLPLFEVASANFRVGSASFEQVLGWAHPVRDVVQFIMPNFYGNPTHHAYFDVFTGQMTPATVNALGEPIHVIDWGIKNYVEGALYLGILPLVLSAVALVGPTRAERPTRLYTWLFAGLALLALTFMFGLPTYGLLFFTLPGIDQLHSPFRWVFAVTLSVAALSGFGLDGLLRGGVGRTRESLPYPRLAARSTPSPNSGRGTGGGVEQTRPGFSLQNIVGWGLIGVGGLTLVGLMLSRVFYPQIEPLVERLLNSLALAPRAFADARMFYSYQFGNVLLFGVVTLTAGLLIVLRRFVPVRLWATLVIVFVAADLMIASWGFNPASDPALLDHTPPSIEWLRAQDGYWRYTTLDDPTRPPIMNANMGMRYELDDIRGYESIIPLQYVEYMRQLAPQTQLDFNRIAPLYTTYPDRDRRVALDSPIMDALNVRYVMTWPDVEIDLPDYEPVYRDDAVRIWENTGALPRALLIREGGAVIEADITRDTGREKFIDVTVPDSDAGWTLVVSESYAPGWRAFIRPQGAPDNTETAVEVERHAINLQAVALPDPGDWTVRLVYSPQSFLVGALGSFLSAVIIAFLLGVWLWRTYVTVSDESSTASRVAKNSIAPILLNLFNRGIDFAFAIVMLRLLGPVDAGIYYYAIIIFGWFEIFTNFGLNVFLTREVSRQRERAGAILLQTSALRLALVVAGMPLLGAFLGVRQTFIDPPLSGEALLVIGLLYIGLIPGSFSTGLSALFYAFERAEIPAAIATIATISKTLLGLAALLAGLGAVGLAGASILTNVLTLAVMLAGALGLMRRATRSEQPTQQTQQTRYSVSLQQIRAMTGESLPLMLNHFLASIFFQIDVILIEAIHGARMVGQYSVAYKWVLALNIIPAFFTQALLPVLSRLAQTDRAALKTNYTMAIKLLVTLALPTAIFFTVAAYALTGLLGGAEFLPDGAIALQLMIWSIPIGWMNSLTQYVLIALDLQRRITGAFFIGVTFNIVTNLIFIPLYGYRAAALTTIASEIALFIPFAWLLRGALGPLDWWDMLWRAGAAASLMVLVLLVGWSAAPLAALLLAVVVYGVVSAALYPGVTVQVWSRLRIRFAPLLERH